MGLELYAGTLNRYCSGDWLTAGQQAAQAAGLNCTIDYGPSGPPWIGAPAAAEAVAGFRRTLSTRWGERFECFKTPPTWNESEGAPYHVEKPDYDGVRSLVLLAAYLERPALVLPEDYESDPAYDEAGPQGYYMGNMAVLECHLFLPGAANFVVVADDPLGVERFMTSVGILRGALDDLNARLWQASAEDLEAWLARGLVSFGSTDSFLELDPETGGRTIVEQPTRVEDKLQHNAQYALACFYAAADFALVHDLPVVVDQ